MTQILVALSSHDPIEDVTAQIARLAKPGTKVTFLMRNPLSSWAWLRDHWIDSDSSRNAMSAARKVLEAYSNDSQRQVANRKVLLARDTLARMGVEVEVDVYTGSFKTIVESYARIGDVSLVMRSRTALPITRFLHKTFAFLGSFKKSSSPQILYPSR